MADKARWAIRRFCLECQGGDAQAVADCVDSRCFLYPFRLNRADIASPPTLGAPARAVRRFCMACVGSRQDVRGCDAGKNCALWSFRFGVHPATFKRVLARRKKTRGRLTLPGF